VLLLVHDPDPEQPNSAPKRRRLPAPPWRPFAWVATFLWLLYAAGVLGGLAGYLTLLAAISLGCWRIDRWLSKQYWGGLRETQRF
jgi:hypothetical protein